MAELMKEAAGEHESEERENRSTKFSINDNVDVLTEILKRLDDRSLGVAACVCRLWCSLARNDSLREHLCFRQLSSPQDDGVRAVVVALGGYRRLYMGCVKPVLSRLQQKKKKKKKRVVWTSRHQVELSLSLFCVDYYERVLLGTLGGDSSLQMLLCGKPVNV